MSVPPPILPMVQCAASKYFFNKQSCFDLKRPSTALHHSLIMFCSGLHPLDHFFLLVRLCFWITQSVGDNIYYLNEYLNCSRQIWSWFRNVSVCLLCWDLSGNGTDGLRKTFLPLKTEFIIKGLYDIGERYVAWGHIRDCMRDKLGDEPSISG